MTASFLDQSTALPDAFDAIAAIDVQESIKYFVGKGCDVPMYCSHLEVSRSHFGFITIVMIFFAGLD